MRQQQTKLIRIDRRNEIKINKKIEYIHKSGEIVVHNVCGVCEMRIVRFHLEPWQRGGSEISSPSPSLPFLSPSVQRRQRTPSFDDLSSIDTTLFEKKSSRIGSVNSRKVPQMVKRLSVLCSDFIASNVGFIKFTFSLAIF